MQCRNPTTTSSQHGGRAARRTRHLEETEGEAAAGTNLTVVDLETGRTRRVSLPEFAPGDADFKLERIGDKLVFRGSSGTAAGAYAIDPRLRGERVLMGASWYFVPSATEGRVWLALDPEGDKEQVLKAVREVTIGGEVVFEGDAVPPRAGWPEQHRGAS